MAAIAKYSDTVKLVFKGLGSVRFFKKLILLFIKDTVSTFIMLRFLFQINAVLFNSLFVTGS